MKRLITVIKNTFLIFTVINLPLAIIFLLDSLFAGTEGIKNSFEYLGYTSTYGIITSVIFGYMDRPVLEKRLLYIISISSAILLFTSFINDNHLLRTHSLYLFFGVVVGRKVVLIVDMLLNKKDH